MKTREEIKASIRRKSAARLDERARRRRAAMVAACVVPVIGAAGLWQLRDGAAGGDNSPKMGAMTSEGDCAGGVMEGGYGADITGDLPQQEDGIYSAYNAAYAAPDSMRIYTLPDGDDSREISLSAKNADEQEIITQMSDWICALSATQTRAAVDDSAVTYVIERHYGGNVAIVYVQGSRVKFEGGEWLAFSAEDEEAFQTMMGKIFE